MIALAHTPWSEDQGRHGALLWILGASVGLHLVVFGALPTARRVAHRPALPTMTIIDAPPPPPPPPPPLPKVDEPRAAKNLVASRVAPAAPARAEPRLDSPPATQHETAAPLDFSSTVFSGEGAGIAVAAPRPRSAEPSGAPAALPSQAKPVAPPAPRVVEAASLARRPRAPSGLDLALERNYPLEARRSGISGTAVLRVKILPSGSVGDIRVVSESHGGFGQACERTVRGSSWEPPIDKDGTPVATEITYTCRFEVRS